MIIKVKKVKNKGWGSNMVKAYEGTKTKLIPAMDKNGHYVTGLTVEDERRLEEALEYPKGSLSKMKTNKWWTEIANDGLGFYIKLEGNTPLVLDTDNPEDELKYKVLLAQKRVAKSMREASHPTAEFVIFNEEEEAEKENKRGKNKRLADALFDTLSTTEQKNVLLMYGKNAESSSPAIIENQLYKLLESDPAVFLINAKDPNLKDKVFVLNLVTAGILSKKGGAYIDAATEDILSYDMDGMIKFFEEKKNNGKLIQFKEALKNRQ